MEYENFFKRVQDSDGYDRKLYNQKIRSHVTNKKDLNLFQDCFSNHTEFVAPLTSNLVFDQQSTKRYIQRDNLSAYFVNKIYELPKIYEYDTDEECSYAEFIGEFAEKSHYVNQESRFKIGTNRIRYLLGDVGQGKSALIQRIFCDLDRLYDELDPNFDLLCVSINLEKRYHYSEEPRPLNPDFLAYLFEQILDRIEDKGCNINIDKFKKINPYVGGINALKSLIADANESRIRIVLFIDNLDFYHYYDARYAFFPRGYRKQEKLVEENILWLRSILTSPEALGHMGLNIMIATRIYVYEEFIQKIEGVDTEIDTTQAVYLEDKSENVVIGSRLNLLSEAAKKVYENRPGAEQSIRELLFTLRLRLFGESIESQQGQQSPLSTVYKLGQHGHRSLVQFLASLNLSHSDRELIERFFRRQVSSLYILYFNNMYTRFSQEKKHFPNMFLVDCVVMPERRFPEAHASHMHSYWLKYFILKYICVNSDTGVRLNELLKIFTQIGCYDEHLVRHVVGSLCTANEFRCAEVLSDDFDRSIEKRRIVPTERGKMLFQAVEGAELCFEFEYLGTVVDDKWLAFPRPFFSHVCHPKTGYFHLYEKGHKYVKSSLKSVTVKGRETLYFLRILEAALLIEIKERQPNLSGFLDERGLLPDFEKVRHQIVRSTQKLLAAFSGNSEKGRYEELIELVDELNSNADYENFFRDYYVSDCVVTS